MANEFYKPEAVARLGVALVTEDFVLAQTVNRDFEAEFGGRIGMTVNVKVPAVLQARTRGLKATGEIETDNLAESSVPVALTTHAYSAVVLDDEDLTLEIEDFGAQVLAPQSLAVANYIEDAIAAEMSAVAASSITWDADPTKTFVDVRKALRDLQVPSDNLYAAVGTGVAAELLKSDALKRVDASGSSDALRNAVIGRIAGFTVIESNRLAEDEAVFYHRAAFTLAVRAPQVPAGVTYGASVAGQGFAMRHVRDYDSKVLADRSIVSTFVGMATMPLKQSTGATVTPAIRIAGSGS
jgi:hypothetical protein